MTFSSRSPTHMCLLSFALLTRTIHGMVTCVLTVTCSVLVHVYTCSCYVLVHVNHIDTRLLSEMCTIIIIMRRIRYAYGIYTGTRYSATWKLLLMHAH